MADKNNPSGNGLQGDDGDIYAHFDGDPVHEPHGKEHDPSLGSIFEHLIDPVEPLPPENSAGAGAIPPSSQGGTSGVQISRNESEHGLPFYVGMSPDSASSYAILNAISEKHTLLWLVNVKASKLSCDEFGLSERDDLLASFPPEVANENSMHVIPFSDVSWERLELPLSRDAAICISSELDTDKFGEELRIVLAWFVRSSTLKFHLENGSSMLTEQLFANIGFMFLIDKDSLERWFLFMDPKNPQDRNQLGLAVSPDEYSKTK